MASFGVLSETYVSFSQFSGFVDCKSKIIALSPFTPTALA